MGRYGTREAELDDLLRRGVFVDLFKVVRKALRASRPGYGLKEIEAFLDFDRQAELKDGGASIVDFERWMQTRDDALLDAIDAYNEEDCLATLLLRDWLLERRPRRCTAFGPFPLPEPNEPKPMPPSGRQSARGAARAAARRGRGARRRSCSTTTAASAARLVGLLRPVRADAERAASGRGVDRPARAERRAAAGRRRRSRYVFTFPAQEHKLEAGEASRPGDGRRRRRDPRARPRGSDARARARAEARGACRCRRRSSPAGRTTRATSRRRSCGSAARSSPATAATRRSSRCCGASRSARAGADDATSRR